MLCIIGNAIAKPIGIISNVAKPAEIQPAIPLPVQDDEYPEGAQADQYIEDAPQIQITADEEACGMVIFTRHLTEPIWANTNPLPSERVLNLQSWGAPGQFVTLNLAVYPLADLKNLSITVDSPECTPEVRVVRYWDTIYPNYNSYTNAKVKRYRTMPEFLAPVSTMDAPARIPQRFYITFKLPGNGTTALDGRIFLTHDGFKEAKAVPFRVQVLPIQLKQDPNKHYSAYNAPVRSNGNWFYKLHKDDPDKEELFHKTQLNEFRKMLEYGFTRPPTLNGWIGNYDGEKDIFAVSHLQKEVAEMHEAGFPPSAEIPITGCSATWLYEKYTKLKLNSFHMDNIQCDKIPEELYEYIDQAFSRFIAKAKANNYPPMIFNPIDEPSAASHDFVKRIYEIFKKQNVKTFLTSPPKCFEDIDYLFDIYNSGAFNTPYVKATSGKKIEYWCYPNDNTFQIKDPNVMCHGGRMTYGYGYWKSGYNNIMPWIWRTSQKNRLASNGGVMLQPDGSLLMTPYWECFRLGVDDLRYIYTLEDAVVKRDNATDDNTKALVEEARQLLQAVWNNVAQQRAYLRDNLNPHAELDAMRAEIANMILRLQKQPETQDKQAPSVIVDTNGKFTPRPDMPESDAIVEFPLEKWGKSTDELTFTENDGVLKVHVAVNHRVDGEDHNGQQRYKIGWPRIWKLFSKDNQDWSQYTHLEFGMKVSSDRNIQDDYNWTLSLNLSSKNGEGASYTFSTIREPGVMHKVRIPIEALKPLSQEALKQMSRLQIVISETHYPDGSNLDLEFTNPRFIGFKAPTILKTDAPAIVALPTTSISCNATVAGILPEEYYSIVATLTSEDGNTSLSDTFPVVNGKTYGGFPANGLTPGNYTLLLRIPNAPVKAELIQKIRIFNGPGL